MPPLLDGEYLAVRVDGVDGDHDAVGFNVLFCISFPLDGVVDGLFRDAFDDERVLLILVSHHASDEAAGDELGQVAVSQGHDGDHPSGNGRVFRFAYAVEPDLLFKLARVDDSYEFLQSYQKDLTTLFIVSQVKLIASGEAKGPLAIVATKSSFGKCERCWNYREAVGKDASHSTLCDRCMEAVQ